jgi:PAS domain S-box-containing protein
MGGGMTGAGAHADGGRGGWRGPLVAGSAGDSRFRAALETMLDSVVVTTAIRHEDGRIVDFVVDYINPAAEIGQRPAEEIVGRRFLDVWPSTTQSPLWEMYLRMMETGEPLGLDSFSYSDVIGGQAVTAMFDIRAVRLGDGFLQSFRDVTGLHRAQQGLADSEDRFRTAVNAMIEPFFIQVPVRDEQGRIVELEYQYVNQAAERLLQMPAQDIVGHGQLELFPSVRESGIWDAYVEAIETGTPVRFNTPMVNDHGVQGSFAVSATPSEQGLLVSARDETAARRAEAALRASEERAREDKVLLSQFLDVIPVGIFIAGPDGLSYLANQEAQRLLGDGIVPGAAAEHLAQVYEVYRAGTDQLYPAEQTAVVRAFRGEPTHVADQEVRQPGGTVILLEVWGRPVRGADGQVEYAVCVFADMSERSAREQTIARQATLLDLTNDAIFVRDPDARITYWNAGAEDTYGFTRAEAAGRTCHQMLHTEFPEPLADIEATVARDGRWEGELTQRRSDGRTIVTESRWAAQRGPDGSLLGFMEVNRDVTARKEAERRIGQAAEAIQSLNATLEQQVQQRTRHLEVANKNLEAFAYSVAHDLRTPLRGISGFAEVLVEDYGDRLGETGRAYAARVEAGCARMSTLIDDMLDLSRVSRATMNLQDVDLSAEVTAICDQLAAGDPSRQVQVTVQEGVRAAADRALIRSVLENLLGNAWKFTARRDDAAIEFATVPAADAPVCCYVRDNGAGFDPAYAAKLFQPFQRLHDAGEFPGNGIGLASVRRIIERHGGRTWAEGAAGGGATIYFTLNAKETP